MARMKKHTEENPGGWSDWVQPLNGYRMACCDCGLVHEMEFEVLRKGKDLPDGTWKATSLGHERYRVSFRARRHERSTSQVRRHRKNK